jgi:hypothetical protein
MQMKGGKFLQMGEKAADRGINAVTPASVQGRAILQAGL